MQQGKWNRKNKLRDQIVRPELVTVAVAGGQTYRVSKQEWESQQRVLMLYDREGRLLCNKPKLGREHRQPKATITRAEIQRVILPTVEIPASPVLP